MPHRFYSPDFARWLSPDPLGGNIMNPQSLNRYAYTLNNPATFNDPLGLAPHCSGDGHNCKAYGEWYGRSYALHQTFCGLHGCPKFNYNEFYWMQIPVVEDFWQFTRVGDYMLGVRSWGTIASWQTSDLGTAMDAFGGALPFPQPPSFSGWGAPRLLASCNAPQTQAPKKTPCTPLANNFQGTSAAGVDTTFDAVHRLVGPIGDVAANAFMVATGVGLAAVATGVVVAGCVDPTPFEPATCAGGALGAGTVYTSAGVSFYAADQMWKHVTLPAIKDWGCHE